MSDFLGRAWSAVTPTAPAPASAFPPDGGMTPLAPLRGILVVDQPPARALTVRASSTAPVLIEFPVPSSGNGWWIDRVTVAAVMSDGTRPPGTLALLYVANAGSSVPQMSDAYLADGTPVGQLDFADQTQPIYVDGPSAQALFVVWPTPTALGYYTARIQYRVIVKQGA